MTSIEQQLKKLGIDPARCKISKPIDLGEGKPKREPSHTTGKMNKAESAFAWDLEWLKRNGKIIQWWFEPITLRLADPDPTTKKAMRYTPDFLVWWADGTMEIVEIKGHMRDDAPVKFKVAQTKFPCFRFRMVRMAKGGAFDVIMGQAAPM